MTKPKKPLRGLFASTEAPVHTPNRPPVHVPVSKKEQPARPQTPHITRKPVERLAPPPHIKPAVPAMIMQEPATNDERIMQIQYNFDSMRPARESWIENDYAQFLRRLDAIQTEAFILRGKLLSEAKNRFFETNKTGWAEFCDKTLGMNYTTANQYIRVADEFDVTSHQHKDLGFEHFKALLPLTAEARSEILSAEVPMSVKMIRTRVKEILLAQELSATAGVAPHPLRSSARLSRMLENIKAELIAHSHAFESLPQQKRWQISAACQNIAAHLNHLAQSLNSDPTTPATTGSRAGAFATPDGVAAMKELAQHSETSGDSQ